MHRLTEVLRRKLLALAAERVYCAYLKGFPFHLPSQQKPQRFFTVLAGKDAAPGTQNQAFNAIVF